MDKSAHTQTHICITSKMIPIYYLIVQGVSSAQVS